MAQYKSILEHIISLGSIDIDTKNYVKHLLKNTDKDTTVWQRSTHLIQKVLEIMRLKRCLEKMGLII
ncbi:unnamed protein product [Absidia cylindrospora]